MMTPKRQTALQLGLLAIVMTAAAILFISEPACVPSAPDGPALEQAAVDDMAEPTATPTVTTAATNTPTPEPTDLPTATATGAAAPSLAPTPNPKLDGILNIWAQGYAMRQSSAPGASRPSPDAQSIAQKTLNVQIDLNLKTSGDRSVVTDFLESRNIPHTSAVGYIQAIRYIHIQAAIPVSALSALAALPAVGRIDAIPLPYPSAGSANFLLAEYEAGLLPGEDANPTFARLAIGVEGDANYDAVKRYLENNGAVVIFADEDIEDTYQPAGWLPAFVPVAQIKPVALMAGVFDMIVEAYPVPAEYRYTQPPLPSPAATATPAQ